MFYIFAIFFFYILLGIFREQKYLARKVKNPVPFCNVGTVVVIYVLQLYLFVDIGSKANVYMSCPPIHSFVQQNFVFWQKEL